MTEQAPNRIVIRTLPGGDVELYADHPVTFLSVDENTKRDRVYRLSSARFGAEVVDALLGSDRIGELGDMPVTEAAVLEYLQTGVEPDTRPKLTLVDPTP